MKNVFSQIGGLFRLIRQPGGLRAAIRYRPFSITSFRIVQTLKRQGFEFKTVVDGGANVGQFSRAAIETFPDAVAHESQKKSLFPIASLFLKGLALVSRRPDSFHAIPEEKAV